MATEVPPTARFSQPVFENRKSSPTRSSARHVRAKSSHAALTRELSPTTTLQAFTDAAFPDPNDGTSFDLISTITKASPSDKVLGARVAKAAQKLKAWCKEIEEWGWAGTFEAPGAGSKQVADKQAEALAKLESRGRDSGVGQAPSEEFGGSLPAAEVEAREKRMQGIQAELDELEMGELKAHVLRIYGGDRPAQFVTRPDGTKQLTFLDDFSILITHMLLQTLPWMSALSFHLDIWSVRLHILREAPGFLRELQHLDAALQLGWDAIQPPASFSPDMSLDAWKEAVETITDVLQGKVSTLSRTLDSMLDSLEGRDDCLPDPWIEEFEDLENEYSTWAVEARRRLMEVAVRDTQRRRGSKRLEEIPTIDKKERPEIPQRRSSKHARSLSADPARTYASLAFQSIEGVTSTLSSPLRARSADPPRSNGNATAEQTENSSLDGAFPQSDEAKRQTYLGAAYSTLGSVSPLGQRSKSPASVSSDKTVKAGNPDEEVTRTDISAASPQLIDRSAEDTNVAIQSPDDTGSNKQSYFGAAYDTVSSFSPLHRRDKSTDSSTKELSHASATDAARPTSYAGAANSTLGHISSQLRNFSLSKRKNVEKIGEPKEREMPSTPSEAEDDPESVRMQIASFPTPPTSAPHSRNTSAIIDTALAQEMRAVSNVAAKPREERKSKSALSNEERIADEDKENSSPDERPELMKRASVASIESFTRVTVKSINVRRSSSSASVPVIHRSASAKSSRSHGTKTPDYRPSTPTINEKFDAGFLNKLVATSSPLAEGAGGINTPSPKTPRSTRRHRRHSSAELSSQGISYSPVSYEDESPSTRNTTNLPPIPNSPIPEATSPEPPLNATIAKRRLPNRDIAARSSSVGQTSDVGIDAKLSPVPTAEENLTTPSKEAHDIDTQINNILTNIKAPIRLTSAPANHYADKASRVVSTTRMTPTSRAARPSPTPTDGSPSLTLSPAKDETPNSQKLGVDSDIKLYHLTQPGRAAPIKLFVRRVGENGERVMVRVGGGWADLGEYLRQYAEHHGRRTASDGRIELHNIEGSGTPANGTPSSGTPTATRSGASSRTADRAGSRPASKESMKPFRLAGPLTSHPVSATSTPVKSKDTTDSPLNTPSKDPTASATVPEVSLGGARAKRRTLTGEKLEWVEGMVDQARRVSGSIVPTQAQLQAAAAATAEEQSARPSIADMGRVGSTKRVWLRGLAGVGKGREKEGGS